MLLLSLFFCMVSHIWAVCSLLGSEKQKSRAVGEANPKVGLMGGKVGEGTRSKTGTEGRSREQDCVSSGNM